MDSFSLEDSFRSLERLRDSEWRGNAATTRLKLRWRGVRVKHSFHIVPGETILELGAGGGWWTRELSDLLGGENQITGAVFAPELFEQARTTQRSDIQFVPVADLDKDLPAESFDYVVGSMMLLQSKLPEALASIRRLLKPGGHLLFFEPNFRNPVRRMGRAFRALAGANGEERFSLTYDKIVHVCSHQGFTHIEVAPCDFLPSSLSERAVFRLQSKAILLEHAPALRWLSESVYLWARKPGSTNRPRPDLAVHSSLRDAVSVVVPCHNEAPNIPKLVDRLFAFYGPYIREIIIVNDNSTDETAAVTQQLALSDIRTKLINRTKPNGVGRALRDGYNAACGRYILSMDCDFVEILPEFRGLFDAIADGRDGAIGSRFSQQSILVNYPFGKLICNRFLHALIKLFLLRSVRDVSNNLKLFRADILKQLQIESPHFSANLETGLRPLLAGYDIAEVPVSWINRTFDMGTSTFHVRKVGPDYIHALIRIWKEKRLSVNHRPQVSGISPTPAAGENR